MIDGLTTKRPAFEANLPQGFQMPADDVARRLFREYGAVYVARGGATPPTVVIFEDAAAVAAFQMAVKSARMQIGGTTIELQEPALNALKDAVEEARSLHLAITPRGSDAARRSYDHTVSLWASRVRPGLVYWTAKRRITAAEARRIRALEPFDQVPEIFRLEEQGIFFSKDLSKSIIYSVAPPGTSQHLSMLALDVAQHDNPRVREVLARHGWFQTVVSDLPHFTYLGVVESELPTLGLKAVRTGGRTFWVPDIPS